MRKPIREETLVTAQSTPREVFMQLLSIITLYFSVASTICLLFQYLNLTFNNENNPFFFNPTGIIRYNLALLIVNFPVYLWTIVKFRTWCNLTPELNAIRIRSWMIYLTLFLATLTMLIDLSVLIFNFLNGDLGTKFLLKVLSLFLVCSLVFYYYLKDLKSGWSSKNCRFLGAGVSIVIALIIGYGYHVASVSFKSTDSVPPKAIQNNQAI